MKRLLTSLAVLLGSLLTTFGQALSGTGSGTENDPYKIFNENQLSEMANYLDQEGVVFRLMNDLDITDWIAENNPRQGWLPIGVESAPFKGKFYGNNHTIKGLMINRLTTDNVGFFGYVCGATITDLTIEGTTVTGAQNVGGLAGNITGSTLTNCHVVLTEVTGKTPVGGIAGYSNNTNFQTFTASATVTGTLGCVGGIVGKAENGGTFSDGSFTGDVIGTGNHTGGLIGYAIGLTLTNITVKGTISGDSYTGGIIACAENSSLNTCNYEGTLTGIENVGGIVGALLKTTSTFTSCFSKGKITATGNYCGGVVGVSQGACIEEMESCSHFGDISGQSYVGGLVGAVLNTVEAPVLHNSSTHRNWYYETIKTGSTVTKNVNNCTAIGNVTGISYVGGLIGSETTANGYTPSSNQMENMYIYEGTTYIYGHSRTYYTYTRNTISMNLTNSYYSGTLQGTDNVGGLYGYKSGGTIRNNYAYANIFGTSKVGGIVGHIQTGPESGYYNTTTLKSNVAINSTVSATASAVGRIYGSTDNMNYTVIGALASVEGNRALTQTKVILQGVVQEVDDDFQNGTSTGPTLLKLKANYVSWGWDFDTNWNILETECFPYKKYQAAPPVIESNLISQATSISGKSLNGGTVYLYYKDREAVSKDCDGHQWTFNTEALQSGAQVQIYADVEGMTPSYFTTTNVGYPGSGTEDDPWRIYTAEDLQGACNRGYYKLMNDIDLSSWINENSPTKGWVSVGRNSGEATYIDGDGHKVSGLWIEAPNENFTGLFSNFSAGQIKNLNVEVAAGKKVRGADYTGILIGRNANGRIVNCSVTGDVEGTIHVGGVAGYVEASTLNAITFDGKASSAADNAWIGGVAGLIVNCTVTSCRSTVTINASGTERRAGGLTGTAMQGGSITKSLANVTISTTGTNNYVGGLVGYSETPITLSFSTGSASATGDNSYTGGLVGYTKSPISNCYSTVNVTGTQYTAGLVGYTFSTIDKCYAKGNVYGVQKGAGVVGELDGPDASLTNSVACNNIVSLTAQTAWGSRVIGNFKNGASDPDQSNYALNTMQVSLNNVPQNKKDDLMEGIAKTKAELMLATTYQGLGWNFSEVWGIDEGQMYPYLLWEIDVNPVADVSFDKTTLLIAVGKTETITASVLPLGATNRRLEWTSSNTAVATVAGGVVTAVAVGTATITATSTDGSNISATCQVTVVANHDDAIAALQAIVDRAQALYDNSTEGENIGEYAAGARAQLLAVINSVNARISSTMSDEAITQCTNEINAAIELFESKKVTAGEDTDISKLANTIYIERVEAAPGGQLTLSVKMKNAVSAESFGFDLYLPEGVTVATDEDGFPLASLSTQRTTSNKTNHFNADFKQDGALNIQAYSSRGYTINGNDGEVALITINIAGTVEAGEYPIILRDIAIADENSVTYRVDYVKSTLAISAYTLGDANSDGFIDVGDLTAISHYILERPDATFNAKAADANVDNNIDVGDLTAVSHIILWGSVQRPNAARRTTDVQVSPIQQSNDVTDITGLDNVIYVEPFTVAANSTYTMSVKMKNSVVAEGFGFDLVLPEGITVATDGDGFPLATLSTERTTANKTNNFNADFKLDGTLNVQAWSSNGSSISGNDGEVAQIVLNIAADVDPDTYPIYIRNIAISDVNATSHRTEEVETAVTVTEASEYDIVLNENVNTEIKAATNVKVKVVRTIKANEWSTICLPFDMTEQQVKNVFGNDVQLAEFMDYDVNDDLTQITVNFDNARLDIDGLMANNPYIIKVSDDITEFVVDGVTIDPDEENAVAEYTNGKTGSRKEVYGSFIGTYHPQTVVPANSLFLSGNQFWYSTGLTKMKAFRAYFTFVNVLAGVGGADARITMSFDKSTGIDYVNVDLNDNRYYDLQGRGVAQPTKKGLYIQNGKKVIIK